VILRFFNIFGPRQDPSSPYSGVISIFSERAKAARPITVFGDGGQTRDFVYVEDLVKILVQGLECAQPPVDATNVGLGGVTTLNDLIAALEQISGKSLNLSHAPARSGDIRHSKADNRRLCERFKLGASTAMADGLARLYRSL